MFSSYIYIYIFSSNICTVRISTYKGFINPSYQYPFRMPFIGAIIPLITSRGPFCRNWWGDLFRDDYWCEWTPGAYRSWMVIPWRQKVTSRSCVPNVHRCQRGVKLANGEGLGVRLIEDLLVSRNGMLGFCFRAKIFLGWWMILEWMKPSPMMNGIDTMVFRRR